MDALGIALVWCALQVTALCAVAVILYLAARRLAPGLGSSIALAALLLSATLTALAFSPWPRWRHLDAETRVASNSSQPGGNARTAPDGTAPVRPPADTDPLAASQPGNAAAVGPLSTATTFLTALADEMKYARPGEPAPPRRWPWVVALLAVAGVAVGTLRLLLGAWAVREYRRRGRPIDDPALADAVDLLRAELRYRRPVELRECDSLVTAATVGWRRPLVLLPAGWREWSDPQRRAVLAHELAHVRRNDFLAWLGAEFGLLLHFYNPLVHWLAGRLRLEQELAADAAAAALSGGPRPYLASLAELALRQSDRRLSWPARAFLPTRRTFLRRIEMLRDAKRLTPPPPALLRACAVGLVLAAALAVAGLRGPMARAQGQARPAPENAAAPAEAAGAEAAGAEAAKPLELSYVPADAVLVGAVRPAAVYAPFDSPQLRQLLQEQKLPFDIKAIEQVTYVLFRGERDDPPGPQLGVLIVRTKTGEQAEAIFEMFAPEAAAKRYAGKRYFRSTAHGESFLYQPDETTLVVAEDEPHLFRVMDSKPGAPERAAWWDAWDQVRDAQAAVAVDVTWVRQMMSLMGPRELPPALVAFAPLWNNARTAAYGISLGDGIAWDAVAYCNDAEGAKRVARTLDAVATLSKNMLALGRQELTRAPDEIDRKMAEGLLDMAEKLLESLTVETEGDVVRVHAEAKGEGADPMLAAFVLPAIAKSREAARRTQSQNNLRQLAIAMHNYADTHGHFPPAVVLGPDGKTPHSWRIEMLPFIEQEALYRQYNMNEPWDSEQNKKVLAQMPSVFRHPHNANDSTNSSYFVFAGPKAIFGTEPGTKGTRFADIIDGTSNTIMFAEAKRDVPWTKPEDIPFDPEKELPELGGYHDHGWNAVFADGAVRFIHENIDKQMLRNLIMMNDGNAVNIP